VKTEVTNNRGLLPTDTNKVPKCTLTREVPRRDARLKTFPFAEALPPGPTKTAN
jgi:hypothetical protein